MTFQTALPVAETQLGIAIETSRGTAVAPAFWLPVMGPKYKPDIKYLPDSTLQGSMVNLYDEVPSLEVDTRGWDSYPYLDTFPLLVRAELGSTDTLGSAPTATTLSSSATAGATTVQTAASVAAGKWVVIDSGVGVQETHKVISVAGTAAPFTLTLDYPVRFAHNSGAAVTGLTSHTFSLLNNGSGNTAGNQPPSCTITDFAGDAWRQNAGSQLNGLNLQGTADALPKYTCDWYSYLATTPSTPTPSYSTAEAPVGWTATLALGGTLIPYVVSWEFDWKRDVKPIAAITGTRNYYQLFASVLTMTAKATVLQDNSATWLGAYINGVTDSVDFTLQDVKSGYAINIHSTTAKFTSGEIDRSKEWVEVPLEITPIPNATDALAGGVSPCTVTIANGQTTQF